MASKKLSKEEKTQEDLAFFQICAKVALEGGDWNDMAKLLHCSISYLLPRINKHEEFKNLQYIVRHNKKEESSYNKDTNGIYIIKCNNYYKIGMTKSIEKRMSSLNGANPYNIELLAYKKYPFASVLEGELHERYLHRIVSGKQERFELDDSDVLSVVRTINEKGK